MLSSKTPLIVVAGLAALCALSPGASAAPARKAAAKKPAVRKAPARKPGGPVVLGTTQLPGDFGQLGTTYTVGTKAPLNFTLVSAEYRPDRFLIGGGIWGIKADRKLLVLNYTVQNPLPRDLGMSWNSLKFTAVDNQDVNHVFIQNTVRTGTNQEGYHGSLKPAQKVELTTIIEVPAQGVVPKLIVERQLGSPVIRYDLRGKVKPLPAPFADPSDPSGATVRDEVPVAPGAYYPSGVFDIRLDSVAYTTEKLNRRAPKAGNRYFTAILSVKNPTSTRRSFAWSTWKPVLRDADGEKVAYNGTLLKASRDEAASGNLEPGEEARVRYFFDLPENVAAQSLTITEGAGRALVYDVSSAS